MNRARVQELRNVIAGIPEKQVDLSNFWNNKTHLIPPTDFCGTVACMAGWAFVYPPFVKAKIRKAAPPYFPGERPDPWLCATAFFDVPHATFTFRGRDETGTDKEIALKRLDALLGD